MQKGGVHMPKYTVAIYVEYKKEELVLEPFSFSSYDSGRAWIERFSSRMERLKERWFWGNVKVDLRWILIFDKQEIGTSPPITPKIVNKIESWYLGHSLAYNIERIKPEKNTA